MLLGRRFGWALASVTIVAVQGSLPSFGAEREPPRMVVNLIGAVKEPFGPVISGQKTERTWRNGDGSTGACLRHENRRWCFEHFPAAGLRLEMLQISVEPLPPRDERPSGPYQYAVDYDLDGTVDLGGSKTRGPTAAADTHYFFSAFPHRADQHRADVQAIYDEGIRIALMYLGE
jgi:hypothetical protein